MIEELPLLIVEGPTDTATAIDLGFAVVGRPACLGCEDMIVQVAKGYPGGPLFIIADSDVPGQRGAAKLQEKLRRAKIVTLPAKDLRKFLNSGGTREIFERIIESSL
jgi:5S rRNA maturation endonuclease (ribonuclease M5)